MCPVDSVFFPIPLGVEAHDQANRLRQQQPNARKGKQVYLNALAVYAVHQYLQGMGIATDLAASDSLDSIQAALTNTADLMVQGLGKVECCLFLPNATMGSLASPINHDRIAYIAVQLEQSLQVAKLLGFVKVVTTEQIPLEKFQKNSLEDFLFYLDRLKQDHIQGQTIRQQPIKLSQWLYDEFQQGWQNLNNLFVSQELAYRNCRISSITGQKIFDLKQLNDSIEYSSKESFECYPKRFESKRTDEQIELCLGLTLVDTDELSVRVGVYPTGDRVQLPADLQLAVINELGETVMQAQAKSTENIQLEFSGEPGEEFSVCLTLGDVSVTEAFVL